MKRVISASLIALLLIGIMGGGFFYFKKYKNVSDKAINAIPPDASFFIDYYPDAGNLKKVLYSNFFTDVRNEPGWKTLASSLLSFDSLSASNATLHNMLKGGHLIISVHVIKAADFDFLYLSSLPARYDEQDCEEFVKAISGATNPEIQTRNYDGANIKELFVSGMSSFTFTVTNGVFAGSKTSFLVEDAIRQQKLKKPFGGDKSFIGLYERESVHQEDKIYFRYSNVSKWLNVFTDSDKNIAFPVLDNFGGWTCLGIQTEKDHISMDGQTTADDTNRYISIFNNQLPPDMKLPDILPAKTAAFIFYGMSNAKVYFNDLKNYLDKNENGIEKNRYINTLDAAYKISVRSKMQSWIGNEYAYVVTEPAGTNYDNNVLAFFSSPDENKAIQNLRELSAVVSSTQSSKITEENYNGHSIGLINLKDVMQSLYGDAFKRLNKLFFTSVKGYVVLSNQASSLRSYIDDYESHKFLFSARGKNIMNYQSMSCNYCIYSRIPGCKYIFKSVASKDAISFIDQYKGLSQWDSFLFQIKNSNGGFVTSAFIQYAQKPATGANLVWATELDTTVAAGPFFVDLGANQKGIIVQDAGNTVYLIDNAGNEKWKKTISEKINSEVYSLDIYKNGQPKMFFNTANYLQVLDMEGNNLPNFPLRLPVTASNSAVVFDYDKSNDYRIYIACQNGRVYGYQVNGKPLPGWNFNTKTGFVSDPIQYFHKNEMDYLVFNDTIGNVFVVNKMGDALITVKQLLVKQPGSLFYLDEDKEGNFGFITIDTGSNLCSVMPDGFVRTHPVMEFGGGHDFVMSDIDHNEENDFLFNDGRQLLIYKLDSVSVFARIPGEQAVPDLLLFKASDGEIKLGTWSSLQNKIYLFNMDGTLYKGFPVKGDHKFYMNEINNDGRKNVLTSTGKEVLLYILD